MKKWISTIGMFLLVSVTAGWTTSDVQGDGSVSKVSQIGDIAGSQNGEPNMKCEMITYGNVEHEICKAIDPYETAWQDARGKLKDQDQPLNYANLRSGLPATMTTKLEAEADAFVENCLKAEIQATMKVRNCSCLRSRYLDERSQYAKFNIGNYEFLESLMNGRIWKSCVLENGVKDYVYDTCVRDAENQSPKPQRTAYDIIVESVAQAEESAVKPDPDKETIAYCNCLGETVQQEYLANMVDGQNLGINQDIHVAAIAACQ